MNSIRAMAQASVRERAWPLNVNKALLLIRIVVGALFIGHGLQKTIGWFGGDGFAKWTENVAKLGMQPAPFWAGLEALAEIVGGVLLILGLFMAFGAAMLIGDMVVATFKVHLPKGLWSQQGGFEYNLVLIAILVALGLMGAGLYSLDSRLPLVPPRPATFLVALTLTLAASAVAVIGLGPSL